MTSSAAQRSRSAQRSSLRRPRSSFVPLLALPQRGTHSASCRISSRRRFVRRLQSCAQPPKPSQSPSSLPPPKVAQPGTTTTSNDVSPQEREFGQVGKRVRALNTRLIVRLAEANIRVALGLLDFPDLHPDSASDVSEAQAAAHRVRKDLRSIRRIAAEAPVEQDAATLITKLEQVLGDVDAALEQSQSQQRPYDVDADTSQELVDASIRPKEDTQSMEDVDIDIESKPGDKEDIVRIVQRTVLESGQTLKRSASTVGQNVQDALTNFVRDDGSIDVPALRLFLSNWLDNAGMTWKRLNGTVSDTEAGQTLESSLLPPVTILDVRDKEKEYQLREQIGELEKQLFNSSKEREAVLRREDQLGKLIRAKEIREMDDFVSSLRRTLAVRVLQLEMEKIFASMAEEIDNCDRETMNEQRMMVVEFTELDDRLATLELFVEQQEPLLIEDGIVGELAGDVQYLKTRLGLDEPLYSASTLSWPQVRQFIASSSKKTRAGIEFYSRGVRLFIGDLRFALRLIRRAVTGYTPTSREIRTIRRTVKDLLTLIPFTIVLIAPLTPVGHVLIFSLLQRYWPEFFPSTFSERRQALMRKYEHYEKSIQEENGVNGDSENAAESPESKGPLASLLKMLLFGMFVGESTEGGDKTIDVGTNGLDSKPGGSVDLNSDLSAQESLVTNGRPHVSLSDLSKAAPSSNSIVQKDKVSIALDELHLAD
ncbi:LETM1-like protein [Gracilaria domingensis]|nr:LETM1-like protein [Gracilaria domingensis]